MPTNRKEYARKHYLDNKEVYLARARKRNDEQRQLNREHLVEYLMQNPCQDCEESDPVVLQFDHVRGEKVAEVGTLLRQGRSWTRIQEEIDKCEVVCANCHFRRTAKRHGGWWKAISPGIPKAEEAASSTAQ